MNKRDQLVLTTFATKVLAAIYQSGFLAAVIETVSDGTAIEVWADDGPWRALITNGDASHKITYQACHIVTYPNPNRTDPHVILSTAQMHRVNADDITRTLTADYSDYFRATK